MFNLTFLFFLAVAEIFGLIAIWCAVRKNRVRSFVVIETHIFVNRLSKRFYGCVARLRQVAISSIIHIADRFYACRLLFFSAFFKHALLFFEKFAILDKTDCIW